MQKIRFQGKEYLLVAEQPEREGAICTPDEYRTGAMGFAHLCGDGKIRSYRNVIGTIDEIEFLGEAADPTAGMSDSELVSLYVSSFISMVREMK